MIKDEYIPTYGPQGFQPIIVHAGTDIVGGILHCLNNDEAFPLLLDVDNAVLDTYKQTGEEAILFPLSYLIDRDGVIQFSYNEKELPGEFSPPTLLTDLESLLDD